MSQCPKCGTSLKEDYGMVTCPACGAILFVDMDGHAHIGEETKIDIAEHEPRSRQTYGPTSEMPNQDLVVEASDIFTEPIPEPPAASLDEFSAPQEIEYDNNFLDNYDSSADSPSGSNSPESRPYSGMSEADPEMLPVDDPLGLNAFANSELSSAKDGMLMCRVFISGVDTKEIRESLKTSMDDARFNWNTAEILSRLKRGQLVMENVTPVKATILINRIKQLPLRIRWEQYTIAQAEDDLAPDAGLGAGSESI